MICELQGKSLRLEVRRSHYRALRQQLLTITAELRHRLRLA